MKSRLAVVVMVAAPLALSGCVTTTYSKTVSVEKDPEGRILRVVESETVTQPGQSGWPIKLRLIPDVQPNSVAPSKEGPLGPGH